MPQAVFMFPAVVSGMPVPVGGVDFRKQIAQPSGQARRAEVPGRRVDLGHPVHAHRVGAVIVVAVPLQARVFMHGHEIDVLSGDLENRLPPGGKAPGLFVVGPHGVAQDRAVGPDLNGRVHGLHGPGKKHQIPGIVLGPAAAVVGVQIAFVADFEVFHAVLLLQVGVAHPGHGRRQQILAFGNHPARRGRPEGRVMGRHQDRFGGCGPAQGHELVEVQGIGDVGAFPGIKHPGVVAGPFLGAAPGQSGVRPGIGRRAPEGDVGLGPAGITQGARAHGPQGLGQGPGPGPVGVVVQEIVEIDADKTPCFGRIAGAQGHTRVHGQPRHARGHARDRARIRGRRDGVRSGRPGQNNRKAHRRKRRASPP
ncbi:hypothetical protein ASZ90_000698 [hydrocarbon metagenome]|uniref:Uncharacterized protein n=1 Tax=hydrocarbon metagenome TaxID=938273 RepID=A0A0W8G8N8_9ZZZZ